MACIDFPTDDELVLLEKMKQQNLISEHAARLARARASILSRLTDPEDQKIAETLELPEKEIALQKRLGLTYCSKTFKDKDEFGKAEQLCGIVTRASQIAQPVHPLVWKTRVSLVSEIVGRYGDSEDGQKKLLGIAQNGPKLREVGDWKSSTFPKEGGVKDLPKNKSLGNHAENLAAAHLGSIRPELKVLGVIENSSGQGIDLITRDTNTGRLVAVEIKGQDMPTKAKAPHQLLKPTKHHGMQGSEEWLHHHILDMAMQKAADMATSRPGGASELVLNPEFHESLALEKELLMQEGGIETYVISAQAKGNGMMTRISHRKGGETEFKEITDKPQYISLDAVVPPKVEEPDVSQDPDVIRELNYRRSLEDWD